MFIVVDLPEPDGAHHRDEIAGVHNEIDALQRLERRRPPTVGLGHGAKLYERGRHCGGASSPVTTRMPGSTSAPTTLVTVPSVAPTVTTTGCGSPAAPSA